MFIKDGIIYGSGQGNQVRVETVRTLPDQIMLITFNTGETRLFDASVLEGPVFEALREPEVYSNPVIEHGIVTWKNGEIDCAPEFMYDHSYEYQDEPMVGSISVLE